MKPPFPSPNLQTSYPTLVGLIGILWNVGPRKNLRKEQEAGFAYSTDEFIEDTCSQNLKEVDLLMKRMKFENDQLDLLEKKIEELENSITQTLAQHAKKQKK